MYIWRTSQHLAANAIPFQRIANHNNNILATAWENCLSPHIYGCQPIFTVIKSKTCETEFCFYFEISNIFMTLKARLHEQPKSVKPTEVGKLPTE
jgi:hypothetical protein